MKAPNCYSLFGVVLTGKTYFQQL